MKRLIKVDNPMLTDLIGGNLIFLIIGEVIIWIFLDMKSVFGYLLGVVASIFMVIHMAYCIDDSVRMDEDTALKHTRKGYVIRTAVLVIILLIVYFTGIANPVAMVCGTFVLKLSAYIQPITNRITSKFLGKGR